MSHPFETVSPLALPPIPSRQRQGLDKRLRAYVYLAGSTAHANFMKNLGATAFFIGVSGRRDVNERIENRRQLAHGSILANPADPERGAIQLEHGGEWFLVPVEERFWGGCALPTGIRLTEGMFEVDLPVGTTSTAFDDALAKALEPRELNRWLATKQGRSHMVGAGYDPELRLHTDYQFIGRANRRSPVREAYLIRPRRESPLLIQAISTILDELWSRSEHGH